MSAECSYCVVPPVLKHYAVPSVLALVVRECATITMRHLAARAAIALALKPSAAVPREEALIGGTALKCACAVWAARAAIALALKPSAAVPCEQALTEGTALKCACAVGLREQRLHWRSSRVQQCHVSGH
jgi:hypothetical protein